MRGLILMGALLVVGCHHGHHWQARQARISEAKTLIADHCGTCHRVPGVAGTQGRVGPSLEDIGQQIIIAGHFVNTPDNLARWISAPQELLPGDVMPDTGVTYEQARLIASYLYSQGQPE
jgi:cytochrome c2